MQKRLRPSGIHGFANRLSRPLLKSCRQKEIPQKLIHFLIFAHNNAANQLMADHGSISFSQKNILHSLDGALVSLINLRCQNPGIGPEFRSRMVINFRGHISCKNIGQTGIIKL